MSHAFNRRHVLAREAAFAVERAAHAQAIWLEEQAHGRENGMTWAKALRERAIKRWAKAAAMIARLDLTLDERRATR